MNISPVIFKTDNVQNFDRNFVEMKLSQPTLCLEFVD